MIGALGAVLLLGAGGSPAFRASASFVEDKAALAAFRETKLAQSIPAAYEAVDIRGEVFDVLFLLHPERGPLSA